MCIGGSKAPPPDEPPAAAPPPAPGSRDEAQAPIINTESRNNADTTRKGRRSLRIDLASAASAMGGPSGLAVPV